MTLTKAEAEVWARAWERSLASGDDHGYAAYVADEAVARFKKKTRRQR